jgi:hypothetical protein
MNFNLFYQWLFYYFKVLYFTLTSLQLPAFHFL